MSIFQLRAFAVLLTLALFGLVGRAHAFPQLAAYSSSGHFSCALTSGEGCQTLSSNAVLQSSLLPSIVDYLTSTDKNAVNVDHLSSSSILSSSKASSPGITILVHSIDAISDPASLIVRSARAVPSDSATAFRVPSDQVVHSPVLTHDDSARSVASTEELEALVMDHSSQLPAFVSVPASSQREIEQFFNTLYVIAQRTQNNVAIVFSLRQEDEKKEVDDSQTEKEEAGAGAETNGTAIVSDMFAPEITAPQLTGLIVGFLFLAIFIPGFLCLWRIQTPQTFAILDSNDMKKKLQ